MKSHFKYMLFLVIAAYLGCLVSGRCAYETLYNTPFAACVPSDNSEENCPHNFIKLAGNTEACNGEETKGDNRPYVCCFLTTQVDLKIKDAPCLSSGTESPPAQGDQVQHGKKSKSH